MIKSFLLTLVGQRNAGRLDYLLNRKSKDAWGPLNGQSIRQRAYTEIMSRIRFQAIVETGTYRGTTTEYFAASGLPIYTVEIHPRAYGYASLRFRRRRHQIHAYEGDSPDFLKQLANMPDFPKSKVFFYLDAHVQDSSRYHKAPLVRELEIIFTEWTDAVVMIDDFQVPGTAYGFDDWGPGKTLNLECLEALKHLNLTSFFPAPDPETGNWSQTRMGRSLPGGFYCSNPGRNQQLDPRGKQVSWLELSWATSIDNYKEHFARLACESLLNWNENIFPFSPIFVSK